MTGSGIFPTLYRLARRAVFGKPGPVYFSPSYRHFLPTAPIDPVRAERIVVFLLRDRLLPQSSIATPVLATIQQLLRVHDPDYLERLQDPSNLVEAVGLRPTDHQRQKIVETQRLMTGGTLAAAQAALRNKRMAVNLGGGLHHARAARGRGFCLLNDVAVAVADLRHQGFSRSILVVDLDLHDGDGTRSFFSRDETVFTFSVHNAHWDSTEALASESIELGPDVEDAPYLALLEDRLPSLFDEVRPGLVFYLAGADVAADDRIGNWRLSPDGIQARDRLVYRLAKKNRLPLVVLLAGGYGPESWRHSARFLARVWSGQAIEPPSSDEILLERYRLVTRILTRADVTGQSPDNEWGLEPADIALGLEGKADSRFLGYYTEEGLELILEQVGLFDRLRDLGFEHPTMSADLHAAGGHALRVYDNGDEHLLLMEAVLKHDRRSVPDAQVLAVEWLLLQNPRAAFSPERPALPGQSHPGLGLLKDVMALLIQACERLHLDGIFFCPSHYHLGAHSHKYLRFLDPEVEGRFLSLADALSHLSLREATAAVHAGRVFDRDTGEPVKWHPAPMVLAISDELMERFEGKDYQEQMEAAQRRTRLIVQPEQSTSGSKSKSESKL